jgi:GNAT superfamily N-acetyltransferase
VIDSAEDLTYRPVRTDELTACTEIWRTSINDYIGPLGQPAIDTSDAPLLRLYGHLASTDPERFVVAVRTSPESGQDRIVGFVSAIRRERLWYLSMLFVLPEVQRQGVGRALLAWVMPPGDERATGHGGRHADDGGVAAVSMATATDSVQPISNALYATYGMVPKLPLLNLIGRPERTDAFDPLPSGVTAISFEDIAAGPPGGPGHRELTEAVDELDRDALGVAHPLEHRFLRSEARRGWLYRGPDGAALGYGYAGEAGRVGPVATTDAALVVPILGHLMSEVVPRGAFALWLPGAADRAVTAALHAGFRLDSFPILLCWDRPFADFSRYLPISPGLL